KITGEDMMQDDGKKRPNGHLDVPDSGSGDPSLDLGDIVSPVRGGSVLEMQTGLYRHGGNRARPSGTTESPPPDVEAITEPARAMARQTYRDKFDPSANAHDAMHQTEYERLLKQRADAEATEEQAAANHRDAEIKLAITAKAGPQPHARPLSIVAF